MRGGPMRGGPMRGGHSDSINAENFILNSHMLPKLEKLKNKFEKQNEFKNRIIPQRGNTQRE